MKLRIAFTATVYAAVLVVGALLVTGSLKVGPFGGNLDTAHAIADADRGSDSTLLCWGCGNQRQYTVKITVTFHPNYGCNWGCNNYHYNPCSWGCHNNYQTYNYNPCNWGCYNNYNWNNCNWGCGTQYYYSQPVVYHQPVRWYNHCGCSY
jgi:hypothetical protein